MTDLNGTTALNPAKQTIGFAGSVQEMVTIKRWMQFCLDDLKVELDGELVMEAPLIVHDAGKAWSAFLVAFPEIMHLTPADIFKTVRIATHETLSSQVGPQTAIGIELRTPVAVEA